MEGIHIIGEANVGQSLGGHQQFDFLFIQSNQENSVPNELTFYLTCSISQIPNQCANIMDSCGQLFESTPGETMEINQYKIYMLACQKKLVFISIKCRIALSILGNMYILLQRTHPDMTR